MNYQELKQLRDNLEIEFHDSNLQTIDILYVEDYDKLLYFIAEYSELTKKMLQCLKEKEQDDIEDGRWIQRYLSLGE